jgi:hypothetical protein
VTKYIGGLYSHMRKELSLFEVKALEKAFKKVIYIEMKHGKKFIDVASTS